MSDDLQAVNPRARLFRTILSFYGVGIYIFLFAPIAVMILLSFNSSGSSASRWRASPPTGIPGCRTTP